MKKIIAILLILIFLICITSSLNFVYAVEESSEESTVDDIFDQADDFIHQGEEPLSATGGIDETLLSNTTDFLYNLLLAVGIVLAVGVGSVLGIKYMMGSVEEKAEYKQTLVAYLISCVVVFGAFGIWKLAINILSGV
mgnify:FL=1